jgi:O-antigen ligase
MHRPPEMDQHWDKAHSSYLENAFELGLPAVAVFYGVLAAVAGLTVRGLIVRRRHRVYPALGFAALVLAGGHAVVDFTLQMPANALWLAALAGVGVAQSIPTRRATAASASGRLDSARR